MQILSTQMLPAGQPATWTALMDPQVLKDCIPGCESIESAGQQRWWHSHAPPPTCTSKDTSEAMTGKNL